MMNNNSDEQAISKTNGPSLSSLPLFVIQPFLKRIVTRVAEGHPDLFERLGESCGARFLINPVNLPFSLLFQPDPSNPQLTAHTKRDQVAHDVYISGKFLTLLKMIDCQTDSDALFFNRELKITGPTEAVVALRNALDDMDTTLAEDVAACFGPLSTPIRKMMEMATRAG